MVAMATVKVMGLAKKRRLSAGYSRLLLPGITTSTILAMTKKM